MIIFIRILFILSSIVLSVIYFTNFTLISMLIAAAISTCASFLLIILFEYLIHTLATRKLLSIFIGFFSGLMIAHLVVLPFSDLALPISPEQSAFIRFFVFLIIVFTTIMFFLINNDELTFLNKLLPDKKKGVEAGISYKILDTSSIIDGRIADICQTGFIEGILVIPGFVVNELQLVADSKDSIKRNRGRRGLEILNKMQKDQDIMVKISEMDFPDIPEVDDKLVKIASVMNAKLITNDYNLNKVAELHGVPVLNINDLSNSLKPVVLPGEKMNLALVKEGKDQSQAIGYLDDGTMVVVENGRKKMNQEVEVVVTSVLQTAAGRMIFAKIA